MPTRQSFVVDLVGKKDLHNAIALNSSMFNAARILGDPLLFRTAETASQCIKRDVIFAQSLWHS